MRMVSKFFSRAALVAAILTLGSGAASADVVITGSDEFIAHVEAALAKIRKAGGPAKDNLDQLEMSMNDHVINENCGLGSSRPANTGDSKSKDAGGTGKGSGTTVNWDPDHPYTYKDGVDRDPCAALAHELSHAADADSGTRDPRPDPASGVKKTEIRATSDENRFRKAMDPPKPPRTKYGCKDLPEDAVCPPHLDDPLDHLVASALVSSLDLSPLPSSPMMAVPVPLPAIQLAGSASSTLYNVGDPVLIYLTLLNPGNQAVSISPVIEGNVQILSLTRDGVAVPAYRSELDLEDDYDQYLSSSLVTLAAGATLSLNTWHSDLDLVHAGQAIGSPVFSATGAHVVQMHSLTVPGNYRLVVTYQYAGPTTGIPANTFTRRTNNATIKFTIQ